MADDRIIEQDATSEGEALEETTQEEPKPEEKPQLDEEFIRKIAAEAAAAALEQGRELGRREMQSIKDAEVARAQREAYSQRQRADTILAHARQSGDTETYDKLQNVDLRHRVSFYEQQQRDEMERQNALSTIKDFENDMVDLIESFGLKANDPRIDWGNSNSMNLSQRLKTIKESAKRAYREDADVKKAQSDKQAEEQKKRKEREESGVDKHDIVGTGVSASGIPTDMATFRQWVSDLPQDKYAELRPKIEKMLAEGKIK